MHAYHHVHTPLCAELPMQLTMQLPRAPAAALHPLPDGTPTAGVSTITLRLLLYLLNIHSVITVAEP